MTDQVGQAEDAEAPDPSGLAVIIMNYRRPQNIGKICRAVAEALPEAIVFLLDQADDDSRMVRNMVPQAVWYRRAANSGCIARLRIAAALPFERYLAVDDDLFLTRTQLRQLATRQRFAPDRVHGIWGQKVVVDGKRLRVHNSINKQDAEVSILNQAYAFSRTQAADALGLIEATAFGAEEIKNCDDILLSSAGKCAPMCHDLGSLAVCQTWSEAGVALGAERPFHETRARLMVSLLKQGRLHSFPSDGG